MHAIEDNEVFYPPKEQRRRWDKEAKILQKKAEKLLAKAGIEMGEPPEKRSLLFGEENPGKYDRGGEAFLHVMKLADGWHMAQWERGKYNLDAITADREEILYWVVRYLTMGEASNRASRMLDRYKQSDDWRRIFLEKHMEILKQINPEWAKRRSDDWHANKKNICSE